MIVNVKNVKQIFINLKATFQKAFDQSPTDWQKVAMEVPSNGKENDYSWLSRFPKMRSGLVTRSSNHWRHLTTPSVTRTGKPRLKSIVTTSRTTRLWVMPFRQKEPDSRQQSYRQILWRPLSVTVLPISVMTVSRSLIPTTWSPVNRCPTKAPKTQSWLACRGESLLRCRPYIHAQPER